MKTETKYVADLHDFFYLLRSNSFFNMDSNGKDENDPILWYRGQEDSRYHLQPKLYRKIEYFLRINYLPPLNFWKEIREKESQLIDHFKIRNFHLIEDRYQDNDLLWLCTMQHFGTATRFLDWSETAITGLYFALEKYIKQELTSSSRIPCVWVFKPEIFNQEMKKINFKVGLKNPNNIPGLIDLARSKNNDLFFISSFSPFNNERVKAQSGAFVLFPLSPIHPGWNPDNHFLENLPGSDKFLFKIDIVQPEKMTKELKKIGVKSSQFYPEMPSISKEVESYIVNKL